MPQNTSNRPLSPHLSIYKPQITSTLSILHRATGLGLYVGLVLIAVWFLANIYGCSSCLDSLMGSDIVHLILVLWTLAWFYHLLNGVRHLCWDTGHGYSLRAVTISGWAVLVGTVVMTFTCWIFVWM